jgi:hypothetical protein
MNHRGRHRIHSLGALAHHTDPRARRIVGKHHPRRRAMPLGGTSGTLRTPDLIVVIAYPTHR